MYNYIGILNKSSAVIKAVTCNFLQSSDKLNLVLAKGNVIEIYYITQDGLESTPYLNVNGKVILIEKIPGAGSENNISEKSNALSVNSSQDNLFILTEDLDFSIISYNKIKNEIVNLDKGSVKEDIGKRQERIQAVFEANYSYAVISAFKNVFKIVFLRNRSKFQDFSVRYEYEDLMFLFPIDNPFERDGSNSNILQTFGVIKTVNNFTYTQSDTESKSVALETFNFNVFKQEINKQSSVDITSNPTCSMIISPKIGGLVVFYSNYLKYYSILPGNKFLQEKETKTYSDRKFVTYCEIDGNRYLAVDEYGNLFMIAFKRNNMNNNLNNNLSLNNNEFSLIFQFLGEVNYASTITYLDNNYLFIGSEKANSQLIKITKQPTMSTSRPFIEIIEEYENLAPISDFAILNSTSDEGSTEILCVSGAMKSCSLKTIRKGTSINIDGEIPFAGVKSIFAVFCIDPLSTKMLIDEEENDNKNNQDFGNHSHKSILLFANFVEMTKILKFDPENYSIIEYNGDFKLNEQTLHADNFIYDNISYILQITSNFISIYDEQLQLSLRIGTVISPILIKHKKKSGMVYIFNKNNLLIRYNVNEMSKFVY